MPSKNWSGRICEILKKTVKIISAKTRTSLLIKPKPILVVLFFKLSEKRYFYLKKDVYPKKEHPLL